jgi:hypothetical protein
MSTVSFFTQCYDKDYQFVLNEERLTKSIENCNFNFNEKAIVVNISNEYQDIIKKCEELKSKNIITDFYLIKDYVKEICNQYNIEERDFENKKSFYINLYNLASIFLCKSDYLVFFTGDSICTKKSCWVQDSIDQLSLGKPYFITNLEWEGGYINEHYDENDKFRFSRVSVSDQNYLVKRDLVLSPDIVECRSLTKEFPHGDTFESRLYNYMENNDLVRCIHKTGKYLHQNFF